MIALTICFLGKLWSRWNTWLRLAGLVGGDDPELVLLALGELLHDGPGVRGVQTLPDLPLSASRPAASRNVLKHE